MKRAIVLILTLSLFFIACSSVEKPLIDKEKKNDLEMENLFGKVKSINAISYRISPKMINLDDVRNSATRYESLYNKEGYYTEKSNYKTSGILGFRSVYKYDRNSNLVQEYYPDSNGKVSKKIIYKYDDKGNCIEKQDYKQNGITDDKYTYEYDSGGYLIEEKWFNSNGNINTKNTYNYDVNGNNTEISFYDGEGNLQYKHFNKFDPKGKTIEFVTQHIKENQTDKWMYKIDDKGNNIEELYFRPDGIKTKTTFKYEFDTENNWVKKVSYLDERAVYVNERIIEYFK